MPYSLDPLSGDEWPAVHSSGIDYSALIEDWLPIPVCDCVRLQDCGRLAEWQLVRARRSTGHALIQGSCSWLNEQLFRPVMTAFMGEN